MSDATPTRRRVHPVDLLVLVMALALAALAYAFLFRRSPLPTAGDPFLQAEVLVEYRATRPWHKEFPTDPESLHLGQLRVEIVSGPEAIPFWNRNTVGQPMQLELRVKGRDDQHPDAILEFRGGLKRGARVRLWDNTSEVEAEVVEVTEAEDGSGD